MITFLVYCLQTIFTPYNLLLAVVGTFVGIIFGAIPGLNGTLAVILFMPMTYSMSSSAAIVFLMCLWIGGASGGFIGSVLLGIPGTPASVATCFDGYPMAKNGFAGKALSIGMVASFFGTILSALIGGILSQPIAEVAFLLGPWEYFGLCFLAITLVISVSKGNILKGLASACIGLLIVSIGLSPIDAEPRFVFDNIQLLGGVGNLPLMIGVFGFCMIFYEYAKGFEKNPEVQPYTIKGFGVPFAEILQHLKTIIRSFVVGLGIGFLPGMGAGLSNIVAYSMAKNSSDEPETFGKGNPDGIWASEVSNNAACGGAMIPMVSLGIPGDSTTAVLIGALTLHGLEMGPMVFRNSGNVVYLMYYTVIFCAILCLIYQRLGVKYFPKILKIPYHYLYPALLLISMASVYVDSSSIYRCGLTLVFALLGVLMKFGNLPTSPLLLAFILGPTLELNMLKGFQYSGTAMSFLTRPISCIFILIGVFSIIMGLRKEIKLKTGGAK